MTNHLLILEQATEIKSNKPSSQEIVKALLEVEKDTRKNNRKYDFQKIRGSWRLCFITGTQTTRQKWKSFIGNGFYIPSFIKIILKYDCINNAKESLILEEIRGKVENTVNVGLVKFSLTGPVKFIKKKNILAFDFNHLTLSILGSKIYSNDFRGGKMNEDFFYKKSVAHQPFFVYFTVEEKFIAARGRQGGLALWRKI
jgi:hypothetical protein